MKKEKCKIKSRESRIEKYNGFIELQEKFGCFHIKMIFFERKQSKSRFENREKRVSEIEKQIIELLGKNGYIVESS